jgi:hypothetical protein
MPKLKPPAFLSKYNTKGNKRKLLGLGAIVIIALISFIGWTFLDDKLTDDKKVYAEAAGHKVYEEEIRDFLGENVFRISDHDAAQVLADKYLTEALAEELGITVDDNELAAQYGKKEVKKQKTNNKYAYQNKLNQVYFDKLQAYNRGVYKGKALVTHFSRFVPYESPLLYEDKQIEPKIGNKAAIAKDKKHAEDLINRLYDDINSGKISFEEAAQIERKDPLVGEKAYPTLSHSGPFDTTFDTRTFLNNKSIRDQIGELKTGELTKPVAIKVVNSMNGDSLAESYFLSVLLDEVSGGGNKDFATYLDEAKKRLGYGVYI